MITLSADKNVCLAEGVQLSKDLVIDYVTTTDHKKRSGIIDKFYIRTLERLGDSIWMLVRDLNGGDNEVISIRNWLDQLRNGIINN